MSISNFNPTIWAVALLANLNKDHVHINFLNRDYEGEIKAFGDTVKIGSIGRVTIRDYTTNSGLGDTDLLPAITAIARPEITQGSSQFLVIDQAKYFNVAIDDVDNRQNKPKLMDEVAGEAGYGLANTADQFVNSTLQTGVSGTVNGTGNRLDARTIGVGAGDDDFYELLVDLGVKLKENDVTGLKWAVIPPWAEGMLQKDVRFTNYGTSENRETLANGLIGRAAGFELAVSNNLSGSTAGTLATAGGVYTVLAGVKMAASYAEQIPLSSVKAFEPHDGFTDALKGLHLYGAKVTRPFALASCEVTQA